MQPGGRVKRARLPSQEHGLGSAQANAMKKIESRSPLAVLQLHLFETQEPGSTCDYGCSRTVMQQGPWRQRFA